MASSLENNIKTYFMIKSLDDISIRILLGVLDKKNSYLIFD